MDTRELMNSYLRQMQQNNEEDRLNPPDLSYQSTTVDKTVPHEIDTPSYLSGLMKYPDTGGIAPGEANPYGMGGLKSQLQLATENRVKSADAAFLGMSDPHPIAKTAATLAPNFTSSNSADCADFVTAALQGAGTAVKGSSVAKDLIDNIYAAGGKAVANKDARPGDIIAWEGPQYGALKFDKAGQKVGYHVAVVAGNGSVIEGKNGKATTRTRGDFANGQVIRLDDTSGGGRMGMSTPVETPTTSPIVKQRGQYLVADYHSLTQDPHEQWLIDAESDGYLNKKNPKSTATGLGQITLSNRETYGKRLGIDPNTLDPNEQLTMMREYIKDRYGSAQKAVAFHKKNGWY